MQHVLVKRFSNKCMCMLKYVSFCKLKKVPGFKIEEEGMSYVSVENIKMHELLKAGTYKCSEAAWHIVWSPSCNM